MMMTEVHSYGFSFTHTRHLSPTSTQGRSMLHANKNSKHYTNLPVNNTLAVKVQ